ncbi:MAG: hypothetical protein AB8G15_00255 [Saprospiraceae bacterium]
MLQNRRLLYFLPLVLLFSACLKNYEEVEIEDWSQTIAIPILKAKLNIEDLLDNFETGGYVALDNDKFITLVYQGEVFSYQGDEIVEIPNLAFPIPDTVVNIPYDNLPFDYQIDEFKLKEGNFTYRFESAFTEDLMVTITLPNLKKDSKELTIEIPVSYTGTQSIQQAGTIDLSAYIFDFYDDEFVVKYDAVRISTGERIYLEAVNFGFTDLEYDYIIGTFPEQALNLPKDEIKIDLFTNAAGGSIYFEEPSVSMIFENSFGLPVSLTAQTLDVMTQNSGIMRLHSVLDDGLNFEYPTLNEMGTVKTTNLVLNQNNSNLAEVIANNPQALNYEFLATLNAAGNTTKGFIEATSSIKVNVDVALPLWVRANGHFITEKNIDFDASILENVEQATFKLIASNGLPVDAGIQVYFEDDNGVVQDSLLQPYQNFLVAAKTNNEGRVTGDTESTVFIDLTASQLQNFQTATKIRLSARVTTDNITGNAVKFYSDYGVDLQLGVKVVTKDL